MENHQPILFLRLEGPLQSWGERARWNHRDTAYMPTKSGVIGLIACAMGLGRGDGRILELNRAVRIAVRADRPGLLMTDYHTVIGIIRTADGKQRGRKGQESTILSYRQYLQDAIFLVAITGEGNIIERIRKALMDPVWPIYLGRKSCVPSRPVLLEVSNEYASLEDAMNRYPRCERSEESIVYEIEAEQNGYVRRDIVTAAPGRLYGERRVELKPAKGE